MHTREIRGIQVLAITLLVIKWVGIERVISLIEER